MPVKGVKVSITVTEVESNHSYEVKQCPECLKLLKESEVVDKVSALNWRQVDNFNLKLRVVSRL